MRARWGKEGAIGVGSCTIIMAIVLISGMAGSTIISFAEESAERAEEVFDGTLASITTGLTVRDITGLVEDGAIICIDFLITLQAGSGPVDMNAIRIHMTTPRDDIVLTSDRFIIKKVLAREMMADHILGQGEIISLTSVIPSKLGPGEEAVITIIIPEGSTLLERVTTPGAIAGRYVRLI